MTRRTRLDTSDKTIRKILNKRLKLQNGSPGAGSHSLRFTYLILTLLVVLNGAVLLSNSRVRSLLAPSIPTENPPRVESTKIQAPKPAATSTPSAAQPAQKATPATQSTPEAAQSTKPNNKPTPPLPQKIQVEVLNGCGVNGLARRAMRLLRKAGFDVVNTDNYRTQNVQHSFIIDRTGNTERAKKLAKALGIPESRIRTEKDLSLALDATLVLGKDYKQLKLFKR